MFESHGFIGLMSAFGLSTESELGILIGRPAKRTREMESVEKKD
jgi:hypothetical protein